MVCSAERVKNELIHSLIFLVYGQDGLFLSYWNFIAHLFTAA